jgi:glycosyltransferase involved in cell wall biosynthesis
LSPFFSIIIPLYNSAATLPATLDSIAAQEFKDLELVCIDGASDDDTVKLIETFKTAHPELQITLISEPDKGIYDAMNKGIGMAKGEWLYFMGSDDTLASQQVLSRIREEIKQNGPDLVYGNVTGMVSGIIYSDDTVNKVLSRGIHHQGVFYKREIFNYTNKYQLNFKVAADYHLTLKVFCNPNFTTRYINTNIAYYGESGLSSTMYDYCFFSYHYRFLAKHKAVDKIEDKADCLNKSVYCCLYLAKEKQCMAFAWSNLLYYITHPNPLSITQRFKAFVNMLRWTVKPAR